MAAITINKPTEFEVKYLIADMGVRYWEDAEVDGVEDADGDLIPLREGDFWRIRIDVDTGIIAGWPNGTSAKTHYKVCDAGVYRLLADDQGVIAERDGYVPSMLAPGGGGYGDYVILNIDGAGRIEGWSFDASYFREDDE